MNWREAVQAMLDGITKVVPITGDLPDGTFLHWPKNLIAIVDDTGQVVSHFYYGDQIFKIYEEPASKIKLGPEHVGKRVKLRDGTISMIISFAPNASSDNYKVQTAKGYVDPDGRRVPVDEDSKFDIIEILD